jgi:citrate lyase subunit beta / citryl-CoA lyase
MDAMMKKREALANSRTFLFVPGNRPERFSKALTSGADAVVLDLEDSVPTVEKKFARENIQNAWSVLQAASLPIVVRINVLEGLFGNDDLEWTAQLDHIAGIMVPKVESADVLRQVNKKLPNVPILPLIESAEGFLNLDEIAASGLALRLVVGHIDFMADTGLQCSDDENELTPLRFAAAMTSRRYRLAPVVDGVTVQIENDDRLRDDTLRSMRFGFGGKLCIHPRQVSVVHEVLCPSSTEIDWARRVIAADEVSGGAAVRLDGCMVDLPVVLQAQRTLSRARF